MGESDCDYLPSHFHFGHILHEKNIGHSAAPRAREPFVPAMRENRKRPKP